MLSFSWYSTNQTKLDVSVFVYRTTTFYNSISLWFPSSSWRWIWWFSESQNCVSNSEIIMFSRIHGHGHGLVLSLHSQLIKNWFFDYANSQDFADYAEVCFREFGDRVKHWITLNEPVLYSTQGYGDGGSPPNRCSKWFANCTAGDSTTEPYVVTHHLILSHAAAVKVYREKFQVNALFLFLK